MAASAVRTCAKVRGRVRWPRSPWPAEEGVMDGTDDAARFPLPSEIADAPGAQDWRSMYPYFTRFQPEDDQRFWFYNSMHFPEPMPAFDTITAEVPYSAIGANLLIWLLARGTRMMRAFFSVFPGHGG